MGYGRVWVGAFVDTWNGSPPTLKPTPMGYGGGLGWGHEFALAIESLPCHLLARLTPGFKPTPQPKPPGWWLERFQPTHAPTQAPYPHGLSTICIIPAVLRFSRRPLHFF
ncbi:hypothetical protein Hanom_Chr02g00162321 [Helianthus anomalus]